MQGALQREAASWPHATGYTADRITYQVLGGSTRRRIVFRSGGKHGEWREKGTRAHTIPRGGSRAQRAKGYPLGFYWPRAGRRVHFWSVHHPGQRPRPWFERTIRRALAGFRLR